MFFNNISFMLLTKNDSPRYKEHAGYSDNWHAGWTLRTGWGESEHMFDCLSKVAKLDTVDRGFVLATFKPTVKGVLTPRSAVSNLVTFDRQSSICSIFPHPVLRIVFHPRSTCPNTRREERTL